MDPIGRNTTLDGSVTVQSIEISPFSTLNVGSYTLTLTGAFDPASRPSNAVPLSVSGTLTGGTIKLEPTGGSAVEIWTSNQSASPTVLNNLTMGTITSDKTVYIGKTGHNSYLKVTGNFISGSSASAKVSFVKGGSSDVQNPVTSYYCASNGGIANINCVAYGPPAAGYGSIPAIGSGINPSGGQGATPSAVLYVSETGGAQLDVTNMAFTGADAAKFSTTVDHVAATSFSIADGGGQKRVDVICDGASAGTFTATLTVTHNATGSPATYPVSCHIIASGGGGGGTTPIPASIESDLGLALLFLGIIGMVAWKRKKLFN